MTDTLHVFALTAPEGLRHTHLTRAEGLAADLPPLTDWLGAEVNTDEIELFPIRDLGEMALSDYITMAFAAEAIPAQALKKINGIKGHALLVPEHALSEEPAPTGEARLIASLPLARADHTASLPKADVTAMPRPAAAPPAPPARRGTGALWAMVALGVVALILIWAL